MREAERDALIEVYREQIGQLVNGIVQRHEGGTTTVTLGTLEAILPRSEQIPGESHHANERVRAVIFEVKAQGSRVKVVLSRTRRELVRRLFEQEIPEIADGVISINELAREPGYRSKVAVSSIDQRVDCVGACVGVRGNRIKNIVDELAGERIDIVRWNDDPQALIPNALQPAEVDQVILCQMMGRAIVLVREDQLSLAIGRRGQMHSYLVAGTGNKVEDFGVGFYTKYGDGGVDISPIADLLKSEVYEVGRHVAVPSSILEAAPTDGLFGDSRTDEDQLGASYDELEWAMKMQDEGKTAGDFSGREKTVFDLFISMRKVNRHKMDSIPVCEIPPKLR